MMEYHELEAYLRNGGAKFLLKQKRAGLTRLTAGDPNAYKESFSLLWHHRYHLKQARLLLEHGADPRQSVSENYTQKIVETPFMRSFKCVQEARAFKRLVTEFYTIPDLEADLRSFLWEAEDLFLILRKGISIHTEIDGVPLMKSFLSSLMWSTPYPEGAADLDLVLRQRPAIPPCWIPYLKRQYPLVYSDYIRRFWLTIKCAVKLLSLHKRAVVTANHPLRKLERREFEEE